MENIYIIGEVKGSYRTQNLIKTLLDLNYKIRYCSIEQLSRSFDFSFLNRVKRKISVILINIITLPEKIILILYSDIVILTAMNNSRQFEFNIAKLLKKKIITDYYISDFDTLVNDRKSVVIGSREANKLLKNERNILLNSNIVLFLNLTEAKRYSQIAGVNQAKVNFEIVPLCIEERGKALLPFYNKVNDYVSICWWGTYIPLHGLEKIIAAGSLLKEKKYKFKLYLFGDSEEKSTIYRKMIDEMHLKEHINIFNDYTFRNGKLEEFLVKNCDIVLGNFGDSEKSKNVIVNKLIDGVALKVPVLTGESIAPREFFNGEDDIFYTLNNPESIANAIMKITVSDYSEIRTRIENSFSIYINNFSVNSFRKRIASIIDSV